MGLKIIAKFTEQNLKCNKKSVVIIQLVKKRTNSNLFKSFHKLFNILKSQQLIVHFFYKYNNMY